MLDLSGNVVLPLATLGTVAALALYMGRKAQQIESSTAQIPKLAALTEEHCARINRLEVDGVYLRRDVDTALDRVEDLRGNGRGTDE